MLEGLRTAAAGMAAQQRKLDSVANDLANVNTNGYKRLRVGFADLVYERGGRPTTSDNAQFGTGTRAIDGGRTFEQGALRQTGVMTDVGLEGPGFIKVKMSDGRDALTRDGDLHVDDKGQLVTNFGGRVGVNIPAGTQDSQISIQTDGTVLAAGKNVGKITLVDVRSPHNLESVGDNAFVTTAKSGNAVPAQASTLLKQSTLEGSNTDMSQA